MANVKITDLAAYTNPDSTDVLPIVDVGSDVTKKVSVGEVVGKIAGDVDVATDGTATISELPVSKLQDGDARQLLQTDAAGTGVEWTSNVDVPGTLGVTGQSTFASAAVSDLTSGRVVLAGTSGELEDNAGLTFNGTQLDVDGDVVITGDLTVEGAATTLETQTVTVEDKNIELGVVDTPSDTTADGGGITLKGDTDKTINWVNTTDAWTSSEHIELASGKEFYIDGNGVLNATTLGSGVVNSSLTSVGTIATGTWEGTAIDDTYLDTISTAGKVSNSATTATDANTANAIVTRDASGDFAAGTITADLTGNADTATALETARDIGGVSFDGTANINLPGVNTTGNQDTSGNAATATKLDSSRTFAVTGDVTGTVSSDLTSGASIATSIASGVIVDADINAAAAIAGTKIDPDFGSQTIETTGVINAGSGTEAAPSVSVGTTDNGLYSSGIDQVALATNGTERVEFGTGEVVFNDGGANYDFRIEGDTNANLFFVDASIDRVGVGTSSPGVALHVDGDIRCDGVYGETDTNTSIQFPGSDVITFNEGGSEAARIDSSGRLLIGTSTSRGISSTNAGNLQLEVAGAQVAASFVNNYAGITGAILSLGRSRSSSIGSNTVLQADDYIGELRFAGADGTDIQTNAASIAALVDGTPGSNDMPGRLVFSTTADGASSPTEQLRITSDRYVRLASGTGGIQFNGDTAAANALDDYEEGTHTTTATCTSGTVTLASNTDELAYTKIGKLVSVHGRITVDTISNPTGNLTLSLPFVSADLTDSAGRCTGSIRLRIVDTGYDVGLFSCYVDENLSGLIISYGGSTDTVAAAPAMKAGTQIYISITYRTT